MDMNIADVYQSSMLQTTYLQDLGETYERSIRLSWYKFKHHYMDFVKVLGHCLLEGLILYIQDKGFLKDFETTRMTLFLFFSQPVLLIVVQNSIYILWTSVLNRDSLFSQVWVVRAFCLGY